jgi:hypothetical protein
LGSLARISGQILLRNHDIECNAAIFEKFATNSIPVRFSNDLPSALTGAEKGKMKTGTSGATVLAVFASAGAIARTALQRL